MKKKNKLRILFLITILLLILFIKNYSILGSIKNTITYKSSNSSEITFKCKKGEEINFIYSSNVQEGSLKLQLIDSKGTIITNLKPNVNFSEKILINHTDTYIMCVTYINFIGNYKINIKKYKFI